MSDDLVKRLRDLAEKHRHERGDYMNYGTPDDEVLEAATRILELEAKLATAVEALERIGEGDYPMPHHDIYRQDGAHSKHDRCPHGEWMYDGCDQCCADFARQALTTLKDAPNVPE